MKQILQNPLVKKILSYSSISFTNGFINFIYLSFAARTLSKEAMGIIGLFWAINNFVTPLTSFSTVNLVGINIVNFNFRRFINFFSSLSSFILSNLLIVVLIVVGVVKYFQLSALFGVFIILVGIQRTFISLSDVMLIQKQKVKRYAKEKIRTAILTAIIGVILILGVSPDWYFYILAIIVSEGISLIFRYRKGFRFFKFKINRIEFIEYLHYGFPLMIGVGGAWLLNQSDKIIVEHYFGLEILGGYALAFQIGMLIRTFNQALINSVIPNLYNSFKNSVYLKTQLQYFFLFIIIGVLLIIGVLFFNHFIFDIIYGIKYVEYKPVVLVIAGAFVFEGMYKVWDTLITYFKYNYLKTIILFLSAGLGITVSMAGLDQYSFLAPSYGVLVAYISLFIFTMFCSFFILKIKKNESNS